ncbi:MAG TPA: O-antigen translocase [Candidatus Paceibacterota bacterium]
MFITFFKRKIKEDLVKVLSLTALANLIKIGINLVTTKVIAVIIGPNGVAILGQFTNLMSTLTTTSTGGVSNGIVRYVSEYKDNETKYYGYINSALSITLFFSAFSALILVLFAKQICFGLFSDLAYISIIYITAATIILYSANSFLLSIINGRKLYDKFILINLLSSFTGFTFTLILVYFFKVYGALLALATYQSIVILITIQIVRKNNLFSLRNISISFSKEKWLQLLGYSLMAVVGLIWPLINILIRSTIIAEISISSAGIWEGMTRISGLITAIVGTAISTYFLPHFSEIVEESILKKEVISGLKIILVVTFIIVLVLFFFKSIIINILYTKEFVSMKELFLYQLSGDFFWVAKMTLSIIFIAKAMIKKYVFFELFFGLMYLGLSLLFIHCGLGLKSVPLAHLIYNLIYFIAMVYIFRNLFFGKSRI